MCAILVREPFYLRPWEIERLSWYQIHHIYFCDCDDNGKPLLTKNSTAISPAEAEELSFRRRGLTPEQIADIRRIRAERQKGP